ncbi:MAG: arylesterase [Mariprofundaceae bacterium]
MPRLSADAVILAFGDSITFGSGAEAEESYPAVLSSLTGLKVINAGVPGEVTADGLKRLPERLDETQPELLILCHGGNDMLRHQDMGKTADNLRGMIRMARERGVAVVLIAVPRPGVFMQAAGFYQDIAKAFGIPIEAGALPDILADRHLKSDTIHPNRAGYKKLAEAVLAVLQQAKAI